ncbi:MAG: hypothetical protein IRZ11_02285 [Clostridia bacterium]|nr:hypothetical protein [Clostridia bacterium]
MRAKQAARTDSERGSIALLAAVGMAAMLGMAALALDVAEAYRVEEGLENAAIAGALSGARYLPEDPSSAASVALDVARRNAKGADVTVELRSSRPGGPTDQVVVRAKAEAELRFARVFGFEELPVAGRATAQAGRPSGMTGLVPMGVPQETFTYGETYTLKSGDPLAPGNFGLLSFDARGGSAVREYLAHGYPGEVAVGDAVETEPGNKVGPVSQGLSPRIEADPDATCETVEPGSPRILYVPVVSFDGVHGRDEVTVVGFAAFFLESVAGGEVTGCFLRTVVPGDWAPLDGQGDFGVTVVALVE